MNQNQYMVLKFGQFNIIVEIVFTVMKHPIIDMGHAQPLTTMIYPIPVLVVAKNLN